MGTAHHNAQGLAATQTESQQNCSIDLFIEVNADCSTVVNKTTTEIPKLSFAKQLPVTRILS